MLGVSYPTVVARLEQVVQALGSAAHHDAAPHRSETDDVLESLAKGDLSPEEAATRLRKKREGGT